MPLGAVAFMAAAVQHLPAEQIVRHRRDQSAGEYEGREKREDDGLRERPEQVPRDAAELKHRRENDAEHEQRDEGRNTICWAPSKMAGPISLPCSR